MRTASMILGIVGGAIAILSGIILILFGAYFADGSFFGGFDYYNNLDFFYNNFYAIMFTAYLMFGIIGIAAGGVGLAGGIIVKKKNTVAGVLLIIAAVFTFSIPFILAAIFALVKEKEPAPAYGYPQYPTYYPPQYAPYPPQYAQYPPQQPSAPAPGSAPSDQKPQE